ncbi:hypothetical protein J1N09_15140 [Aureitalea sp. L0-47]|uniref:hypothetical protein n=1 Tax=Aureitalea sp. L0-47 TaxID=2816962 RepID=UPI0022376DF3|nr:hypothetical protein [Aureitalea sp. L0-47]MCW5521182.1 hypothetical protein [Aureitalea sp. L0-47]
MKSIKFLALICLLFTVTICCKSDDEGNEEVVVCEMWFEGDPCVAMINKFLGNYSGGAGFCGTNYNYIVRATPNEVNGITIRVENPDGTGVEYTALLTSSTEFDIPVQGGSVMLSGFGNLNGDDLYFFIESPTVNFDCEHNATRT